MLDYMKFIRTNYRDGMSWADVAGISDNFVRANGYTDFSSAAMERFMDFLQTSGVFTENFRQGQHRIKMIMNRQMVAAIIAKLESGTILEDIKRQLMIG